MKRGAKERSLTTSAASWNNDSVVDLSKLLGKLPSFVFGYPDCFLGICAAVVGIARDKGVEPTNAYLPFGFGLIALSMARRNWADVGYGRDGNTRKFFFTFKEFFCAIAWGFVTWACCRWWAMDFHVDQSWIRKILHY